MDPNLERRLCDLVTGAAAAAIIAAVATAHWRGLVICTVAGVLSQVIRLEI